MPKTKHSTCTSAIGLAWLAALSACSGSSTPTASISGGAAGHAGSASTVVSTSGGAAAGTGVGGQPSVGGASASGGQGVGGASASGGQGVGGASTGGVVGKGGAMGGGGIAAGGAAAGGSVAAGGKAAGGSVATGGKAAGGSVATGGKAAGGSVATGGRLTGGATSAAGTGHGCGGAASLNYDQTVLCDRPVAFWAMTKTSGTEPDLTARANHGSYRGGTLTATSLPNGDPAVVFDGATQYLTIASNAAYSIPTTGDFTWEAWINPSVLEFPNDGGSGYVDWMGKCADYSPTCEWEARMYKTTNPEGRCNRISAYVFNPTAGLGSAADWQPTCGLIRANQWYHVVGAYTTKSQPTTCANSGTYPGSIDIWVNGVKWNQARHNPTGCMSQYSVIPKANASPVNIGTMAGDGWFPGAIAKVAFFDYLLNQAQVVNHFTTMTGKQPTGSCANDCSL